MAGDRRLDQNCLFALFLCMVVSITVAQDPPVDLNSWEWSLANEYNLGERLIPQVQRQVEGTCVFHALAYDAETQLRRDRWSRNRKKYVRFDGHSFSTDYIREMMVRIGYETKDRVETALDMFRTRGVFALSQSWQGRRRVPISGYSRHRFNDQTTIQMSSASSGTDILLWGHSPFEMTSSICGMASTSCNRLHLLKIQSKDCTWSCSWVLVWRRVGPYLLFLNSHGAEFGTNGIGRVYFDQVESHLFYRLLVDEEGADAAAAGFPDGPGGPPPSGSSGRQPPAGGAAGGSTTRGGGDNRSKRRRLSKAPSGSSGANSMQSHSMGLALPMSLFVGRGFGFFHDIVNEKRSCQWLNESCGIISVTHGTVSLTGLETKICEAWDSHGPSTGGTEAGNTSAESQIISQRTPPDNQNNAKSCQPHRNIYSGNTFQILHGLNIEIIIGNLQEMLLPEKVGNMWKEPKISTDREQQAVTVPHVIVVDSSLFLSDHGHNAAGVDLIQDQFTKEEEMAVNKNLGLLTAAETEPAHQDPLRKLLSRQKISTGGLSWLLDKVAELPTMERKSWTRRCNVPNSSTLKNLHHTKVLWPRLVRLLKRWLSLCPARCSATLENCLMLMEK